VTGVSILADNDVQADGRHPDRKHEQGSLHEPTTQMMSRAAKKLLTAGQRLHDPIGSWNATIQVTGRRDKGSALLD
jgi:hypothetical protein